MKLIILDSSQIECRTEAWLADETWLLEAFRNKRDPYCELSTDIYKRPITKADDLERFVGKTATLGLGYQMGAPKFQMSLLTKSIELGMEPIWLDDAVAKSVVNTYRRKNKKIVELWGIGTQVIAEMADGIEGKYKCISWGKDYVLLPNGLKLFYPGTRVEAQETFLEPPKGLFKYAKTVVVPQRRGFSDATYLTIAGRTKIYGGLWVENLCQALSRCIVAEQMRQIAQRYRIVLMEHDAIGYLAENREAKKAFDWGLEIMSTSPKWAPDMPLAAEGICDDRNSK